MLRPLLNLLASELSGAASMDHVQTITRHHRIQASPGYRAAAQDCLQIYQASGVSAQITTYPATGRDWEWTHLTPQEWACDDGELWLLGTDGARKERLAWYQAMNLSIIQRSCETPDGGATAELAVVDGAENPASWAGRDLTGKIALVGNGDIHRMLHHAQTAGAVGLLTARMTYHPPIRPEGDLADALQYTSFWWSPNEVKGWGFVLSTREGERLRRMVSEGPVKLWAKVSARFYDGTIENVEAIIPGRRTEHEVLVISHLCHPKPSANDNATGPATVMEAARTLQKLIDIGRLDPPRRTIRFLHPPEMTGTYAHLAHRTPEDRARIVGALNVDMVGQKQDVTGSTLLCEYPPLSCPSYAGDLLALVLGELAKETTSFSGTGTQYAHFRHAVTGFSGGSDHYIMADPTVGVPCPMVIQWPDRFYHTSSDTPDKVDPAMLGRVGVMTAAYAYFLATAGLVEVTWLATEMTALFPAQLHSALQDASDPEALVGFRVDRKLADLHSLTRLLNDPERAHFERTFEICGRQIKMAAELELQRQALSHNRPLKADEPSDALVQGWQGSVEMQAIRPVRVHPGPISLRHNLDQLPEAEADSWRAFSAAHPGSAEMADYLCYWADGERSIGEICRLTALETGLRNETWALGYFQLLGRLGLVKGV